MEVGQFLERLRPVLQTLLAERTFTMSLSDVSLLARIDEEIAALEGQANPLDVAGSDSRVRRLAQLRREAEATGQTLGEYAQGAMRRYANEASDDEWVSLLGALARTQDPGGVCLQRAFAHVLKEAA